MKQKLTMITCIVMAGLLVILLAACGQSSETNGSDGNVITTESGLKYIEIEEGSGPAPHVGDIVKVDYTGTLEDGTQFDSSLDRGEPFEFTLGMGQVIKGWDEGIAMMKEGGKARLIIPPELGYGNTVHGSIPANSTLIFEVELVSVTPGVVVTFPDPHLAEAVREAIGISDGDIYQSDLNGLTSLVAKDKGITDLTGLENCISLTTLELQQNQISDISPLADLTTLTSLDLWDNQLTDISPLAGLVNLNTLTLFENQIEDISPLSSLVHLTRLDIWDNRVSDIAPLGNLNMLRELDLWDNQISDISPLAMLLLLTELSLGNNQISNIDAISNLTSLTHLWLYGNQISDISPLANLISLSNLYLWDNQLTDISPLSELTGLTTLKLSGNQIEDIAPLSNLHSLLWLGLDNNRISDISTLSDLTSLTWLELQNNQLSDIDPLVENEGLDEGDTVDLRNNPLSETAVDELIPQLDERGVNVSK